MEQPKGEVMWVANGKAIGMGQSEAFGAHIMTSCTLEVHVVKELSVFASGFQSCFGFIHPCCSPVPPFGNVFSVPLSVGSR